MDLNDTAVLDISFGVATVFMAGLLLGDLLLAVLLGVRVGLLGLAARAEAARRRPK